MADDTLPKRIEPTPEAVAELRARMSPKRIMRTRLGIIHGGNVPIDQATIDPTKPQEPVADTSKATSEKTKQPETKAAPSKASASSGDDSATK